MELFDDVANIVRAQNETLMSGIELGRKESEERIQELEGKNAKLLEALKGLIDIVHESEGVGGYHLNGDTAYWNEFEEVSIAENIVAEVEE